MCKVKKKEQINVQEYFFAGGLLVARTNSIKVISEHYAVSPNAVPLI